STSSHECSRLFSTDSANPVVYTPSLHDALPIYTVPIGKAEMRREGRDLTIVATSIMVHKALEAAAKLEGEGIDIEVIDLRASRRSEEHTSDLQSRENFVCRLLLEKNNFTTQGYT